jgi:signal transduction histidine kinase
LRQIVLNLLSNAVKFTERGRVLVRASVHAEWIRLQVEDTGMGIEQENLERIFDPFWQVESLPARRAGGTGLGLSVAREFARLLGGDVTVSSTPGRGSTFELLLPRVHKDHAR